MFYAFFHCFQPKPKKCPLKDILNTYFEDL
jgi:hypothetical protein